MNCPYCKSMKYRLTIDEKLFYCEECKSIVNMEYLNEFYGIFALEDARKELKKLKKCDKNEK